MHMLKKDQRGLVSIIVTMLIMLIISIVVVGFATLVRRDQRQALDRQLSTQAFYAAESGVNVAQKVIENWVATNNTSDLSASYPNCDSFNSKIPGGVAVGDDPELAQVSCLLVNPTPASLVFDAVGSSSTVIPVIAKSSGPAIQRINLSWQAKSGQSNFDCGTVGELPSTWPVNCSPGLLRVDIVPVSGSLSRASLSAVKTVFLHPRAGSATVSSFGSLTTNPIGVGCNVSSTSELPMHCKFTINLSGNHYLRVQSIYATSSLTVTASSGGSLVQLVGAQALIDSTGKAVDVLRRIQVRVSLRPNASGQADFPLQTLGSICKRIQIGTTATVPPSGLPSPIPPECDFSTISVPPLPPSTPAPIVPSTPVPPVTPAPAPPAPAPKPCNILAKLLGLCR